MKPRDTAIVGALIAAALLLALAIDQAFEPIDDAELELMQREQTRDLPMDR